MIIWTAGFDPKPCSNWHKPSRYDALPATDPER